MPSTSTDIFLDDGDHFTDTVRLGYVSVYGSLANLSLLRDSLAEAIEAHRVPS